VTKDMGMPRYFLGIEIAHSKHGAVLSQWKYALNLLHDTGLLGCKPMHTYMDIDADLLHETGSLFEDVSQYMILIDKHIYLMVIRSDIAYIVRVVSQFMHKRKDIIGRPSWEFWHTSKNLQCDLIFF